MPDTSTLVLEGFLSSAHRDGHWNVPSHIGLRRRMGSVKLDFTDAVLPPDGIVDISLDIFGGSVEIRVPRSARVEESVVTRVASVQDHRADPSNDGPLFVLHGTATWCSVEVRGPKVDWRQDNRLLARLLGRGHRH